MRELKKQKYFVIDIKQIITLLGNNIFRRNFAIVLAIYWGLNVQHFIQIRLNLLFLLYDV